VDEGLPKKKGRKEGTILQTVEKNQINSGQIDWNNLAERNPELASPHINSDNRATNRATHNNPSQEEEKSEDSSSLFELRDLSFLLGTLDTAENRREVLDWLFNPNLKEAPAGRCPRGIRKRILKEQISLRDFERVVIMGLPLEEEGGDNSNLQARGGEKEGQKLENTEEKREEEKREETEGQKEGQKEETGEEAEEGQKPEPEVRTWNFSRWESSLEQWKAELKPLLKPIYVAGRKPSYALTAEMKKNAPKNNRKGSKGELS
jgi:hypothetical protein